MTKSIAKMFSSINDPYSNIAILNANKDKINLTYILKFRLPLSITQFDDFCLIFNDMHIDNLIIILNIKLNSWVFNCLKSYQMS